MLGSASKAEAANSGFKAVGETISYKDTNEIVYTFTVTLPILDGVLSSDSDMGKKGHIAATNGVYSEGAVKESETSGGYSVQTTTAGFVTLTSVSIPDSAKGVDLQIPEALKGGATRSTATVDSAVAATEDINTYTASGDTTNDGTISNNGVYFVDKIDLNGEGITNAGSVANIQVQTGAGTKIKSVSIQNFEGLKTIYNSSDASKAMIPFSVSETIDVSGDCIGMTDAATLYDGNAKLQTYDISGQANAAQSDKHAIDFSTAAANIKSVNIADNSGITGFTLKAYNFEGCKVNVSNCAKIKKFNVEGFAGWPTANAYTYYYYRFMLDTKKEDFLYHRMFETYVVNKIISMRNKLSSVCF